MKCRNCKWWNSDNRNWDKSADCYALPPTVLDDTITKGNTYLYKHPKTDVRDYCSLFEIHKRMTMNNPDNEADKELTCSIYLNGERMEDQNLGREMFKEACRVPVDKDTSDLVKKLRSGVTVNRLIETLGGLQHYVSNLEAADKIESLTAQVAALETTLINDPPHAKNIKLRNQIAALTAQNEAYDKELKLLAKTARAHNMWEFDRLISEVRKRISELQEKDDGYSDLATL